MDRATKIAAARRFAPPLFSFEPIDKRGARLRHVNRAAVAYVQRAGFGLDEVYPNAISTVRGMAPPAGSREAVRYVRSLGLAHGDVYPTFSGEAPKARKGLRWVWVAGGAVVGGALAGVVGLAVGAGLGLVGSFRR